MKKTDFKMISGLMFRLLPIQILLAAIGSINGIVSSLFASNCIGVEAMSAVGLYGPLNTLVAAVSTMLVGGTTILCGKYMGKNDIENVQHTFSLSNTVALLFSVLMTVVFLAFSVFDLTALLTKDAAARQIFNRYLLGQAIGVVPLVLGNQLAALLSLENKMRTTTIASIVYIVVSILLNYIFVQLMKMGVFGLALASSVGLWIFASVQAQAFLSGKTQLRFNFSLLQWRGCGEILKIGIPGAASNAYQTLRGLLVNLMIAQYVGSVGLSAFAASDSILRFFWAVPTGMLAVSRMMISVSVGEEDRETLANVMRTAMYRYVPLMAAVSAFIILMAVPFTRTMYRDSADPVYAMTVWGFRILPLCMPLSLIYMQFSCYGQASGKHMLVHLLALLDGVVCVAGFTALLIRALGMNSVYIANVLNGVVTTIVIVAYSCIKNRRFPKNMEELMVIPEDFGAAESERLDRSFRSGADVVGISQEIEHFCLEKGTDEKRSRYAALFVEEMAGNIIDHGFSKDKRRHSVDVRAVSKDEELILRLKDDCVPFDPAERRTMMDPDNPEKNLGIRIVYGIARDIQYQNILGLNVLTIRI